MLKGKDDYLALQSKRFCIYIKNKNIAFTKVNIFQSGNMSENLELEPSSGEK